MTIKPVYACAGVYVVDCIDYIYIFLNSFYC